jgi:hypothetical protein
MTQLDRIAMTSPTAELSTTLDDLTLEQLKAALMEQVQDRDQEPMSRKVKRVKQDLDPYFQALSRQNPYPAPEEQQPLVPGIWFSAWSTNPFQDIFPGRISAQSYQIFSEQGYYANIARYSPGSRVPVLKYLAERFLAYDFMIIQSFEIRDGQWLIENVAIKQALRWRQRPLDPQRAQAWFQKALDPLLQDPDPAPSAASPTPQDKRTAKQFEQISKARPQLEHLYIDPDFRLVKTQRDPKQRPSYTVAIRI